MALHDELRQARINHGLTQVELARRAGVPRSQLKILEKGGNVTLSTLLKILSQLPELKTLTLGPVDLQLRHLDLDEFRRHLGENVLVAADRAVESFDRSKDAGAGIRQRVPRRAATAAPAPETQVAEEEQDEGGPDEADEDRSDT